MMAGMVALGFDMRSNKEDDTKTRVETCSMSSQKPLLFLMVIEW
jgi:hypothetical protein